MKRLVILWALAGTLAAYAQDGVKETAPAVFSLQQAIDYAMKNQVAIKNALLDEAIARQRVNEVTGLGLPQINASFDLKDFLQIPTSLIPAEFFGGEPGTFAAIKFGTKYQATGAIDASQLLFSGDYFLGLKAAKNFVELYTKTTELTKIQITEGVSQAYYSSLINQERMNSINASITRTKKTLDDTKVLIDNGLGEKIDYDRYSVAYTNLLVELQKAKRAHDLSIFLLKFQIGLDINAPLELTDKLKDIKFDIASSLNSEKFDYKKRAEYRVNEIQYKLAQLSMKQNGYSYIPTAYAYASINQMAMRNEFDIFQTGKTWFPTSVIGAKISLPIFTGLQRNARYQQAKLKLMQADNNFELIKQKIDLDISTSLNVLQNATASLTIQQKNIETAEEVVKVAKIKYEQGVGTNLELVTAESALTEAQTNYYSALYDALVAKLAFDKANGNIK